MLIKYTADIEQRRTCVARRHFACCVYNQMQPVYCGVLSEICLILNSCACVCVCVCVCVYTFRIGLFQTCLVMSSAGLFVSWITAALVMRFMKTVGFSLS
jgi:hypothetical protein